jgi:hypothetical protein
MGRRGGFVVERLPDDQKARTSPRLPARQRVPKIVNTEVFDSCSPDYPAPRALRLSQVTRSAHSWEDELSASFNESPPEEFYGLGG